MDSTFSLSLTTLWLAPPVLLWWMRRVMTSDKPFSWKPQSEKFTKHPEDSPCIKRQEHVSGPKPQWDFKPNSATDSSQGLQAIVKRPSQSIFKDFFFFYLERKSNWNQVCRTEQSRPMSLRSVKEEVSTITANPNQLRQDPQYSRTQTTKPKERGPRWGEDGMVPTNFCPLEQHPASWRKEI
jgi:hypothetical protein